MRGIRTSPVERGSDPAFVSAPVVEQSDLHSQLEDLLDEVWRDEADWTMNDKIDLSLHMNRKATTA
jgi:hypothetical protein